MKKSSVLEWCKLFKEGCENMEDERSGCPRSHRTDENVEKCRVWCISQAQTVKKAIMWKC